MEKNINYWLMGPVVFTLSGSMLNFFFPVDNCLALGSSLELWKQFVSTKRSYDLYTKRYTGW